MANNVATDFSHVINDIELSVRVPAAAGPHDSGSNAWRFALSLLCKFPLASKCSLIGPAVPEELIAKAILRDCNIMFVLLFSPAKLSIVYGGLPWLMARLEVSQHVFTLVVD